MNKSSVRLIQEPAADGNSCVCKTSFYTVRQLDGANSAFSCQPCESGVASLDGKHCVKCDTSFGEDGSTVLRRGRCECSSNLAETSVVAERDAEGAMFKDINGTQFLQRCVKCPNDTEPNATAGTCTPCTYPKVQLGGKCMCPGTLPKGSRCYDGSNLDRIAGLLRINLGQAFRAQATIEIAGGSQTTITVDNSAPFVDLLDSATRGCYDDGNRTSCNALANLCVLKLYNR